MSIYINNRRGSTLKNKSTQIIDFSKTDKELQEDYETLLHLIDSDNIIAFQASVVSADIKYYLEHNDLDYNVFKKALKLKRTEYIEFMENNGYVFNNSMLLIELYDSYLNSKAKHNKETSTDQIKEDDMRLLITYDNGRLIDTSQCLVEFYFLILTGYYSLATLLLSQNYGADLRENLNQMFIGDENNLLEKIFSNTEVVKLSILLSLKRQLDGIAYEIYTSSGIFLDEILMECAVKHNCSLFLEEVWESSRKFGNIKNFYAPKIGFSKFMECMISQKKYEMASEAIKNWYEAYKEENVFDILLENKCEELMIDLIQTASNYNFRIDFDQSQFNAIIKDYYFLLKVILGIPMYKKFVNSEVLQQFLVDPLRKGQTILPAIECYNSIEEHLLVIQHIEHAGKVLLDFIKIPKNFTFCRYPLLLCCLVCEFMNKLKRRFPVYESFFLRIYNYYAKAGQLFSSQLKDKKILQFHLNRRDLKNRTCLQIMAQNRLYTILHNDNIGGMIERLWGGENLLHGIPEMSSFIHMTRYNCYKDIFSFKILSDHNLNQKQFWFNYYSYRDVAFIRYYFKQVYAVILVALYQTMIYFAVIDKNLENTINDDYYLLTRLTYIGSLSLALNKINSIIFFANVSRWYIEVDNLFLEVIFTISIFVHWFDFKRYFIVTNDEESIRTQELINAIFLSHQITFLWWKIIDSLKATQMYGGFLRTVFLLIQKMFLIVCFFYCFILLCTGVFNLLFQQSTTFQYYSGTFLYLSQAALQEYTLNPMWSEFITFSLMLFMGVCTLILINLIIAFATKIYDEVDENIVPEHRCNLIKLYEYLNWDENFGIFKFLFAPLNIIQIPCSVLVLFVDNKKNWTEFFCKILYFPVCILVFVLFLIREVLFLPKVYFRLLLIESFQYGEPIKKILWWLVMGPFVIIWYFIIDTCMFWKLCYKSKVQVKEEYNLDNTTKITEFRRLFCNLIGVISEKVEDEKRLKKFNIVDLIDIWIMSLSGKNKKIIHQEDMNRMHKRSLILNKYNSTINSKVPISETLTRNSHVLMFKSAGQKISIQHHFSNILDFLFRFADKDGFIEKDLAKNIFPIKNYYDDDYFEFLYYFNYKFFKGVFAHFTKLTSEVKKDMNRLRGVLTDFLKINEKFKVLRFKLKTHKFSNEEINSLAFGMNIINSLFAKFESNLNDAQGREAYKKIYMKTANTANKKQEVSSLGPVNQPEIDIH